MVTAAAATAASRRTWALMGILLEGAVSRWEFDAAPQGVASGHRPNSGSEILISRRGTRPRLTFLSLREFGPGSLATPPDGSDERRRESCHPDPRGGVP